MHFDQYYKSFGLKEYPFGVYTSEAETEKFGLIYLQPSNYSVIVEGLRNTSAIVIGERGTGKTALSFDAGSELSKSGNLIVRIEEFSGLKSEYETEDLYYFITEQIAKSFFIRMTDQPTSLWKYSKDERVDLSMFLYTYLTQSSKNQLRDKINKIQNSTPKRIVVGLYNSFRTMLNYGLKAATKVASDALTKHFSSIPPIDTGDADYLPRIESEVDQTFTIEDRNYSYLEKLCLLVRKAGIQKIYVIIDKVDEDPRFANDAEPISNYIKKMAADNKILTASFFHMLLFFWSTPFNYIKENVRTQKLTFQQLEWTPDELKKVVEKRLSAYSDGNLNRFEQIFEGCSDKDMETLFDMANRNPRDLWHILNKCFAEQFTIDSSKRIGSDAIERAIKRFVNEFNYYEYYPKKSNSRSTTMDVYSYIKHLLKLDSPSFTKDKLNSMAGTGSSTNNYVVAMENMGLIAKTNNKAQGGAVVYHIKDPKVRYAMSNRIAIGV